jgi:hypothetical protein
MTTHEAIPGTTPAEVARDLSFELHQTLKPDRTTIYAVRPSENRMEERRKEAILL